MTADDDDNEWLDSVEGEIAFFRSLMRSRPVGMHRHFHALSMRTAIHHYTGHYVSMDAIWAKLRTLYDLDALESLDSEGYGTPESNSGTPLPIPSPSPSANFPVHPFFRKEFELPYDAFVESELATRRARNTASPESSPVPAAPVAGPRGTKRPRAVAKGKGSAGDSDSSALTQESGEEEGATPRSTVTTEQGTPRYETDDSRSSAPQQRRGRGRGGSKRGGSTRGRGGRGSKKTRTQKR